MSDASLTNDEIKVIGFYQKTNTSALAVYLANLLNDRISRFNTNVPKLEAKVVEKSLDDKMRDKYQKELDDLLRQLSECRAKNNTLSKTIDERDGIITVYKTDTVPSLASQIKELKRKLKELQSKYDNKPCDTCCPVTPGPNPTINDVISYYKEQIDTHMIDNKNKQEEVLDKHIDYLEDKQSTDFQKTAYESNEVDKLNYWSGYLIRVYYVIILVLSYFIVMEPSISRYLKAIIIFGFIVYPFIIYTIQEYVYVILRYMYSLFTSTVYSNTYLNKSA